MTIRDIIGPANPILRRKAKTVGDPNTPEIQRLMDDMIETMRAAPGVGLAAPQVAVGQRIAVIEYAEPAPDAPPDGVSQAPPPPPKLYVIVNPEIVSLSEEMVNGAEGCLSLPGVWGDVMRHEAVTVKALNRKGRPVKIKARGWLARIFQHEIDHLNGVLFIDRASQIWREKKESHEPDGLMKA